MNDNIKTEKLPGDNEIEDTGEFTKIDEENMKVKCKKLIIGKQKIFQWHRIKI